MPDEIASVVSQNLSVLAIDEDGLPRLAVWTWVCPVVLEKLGPITYDGTYGTFC